MTLEDDAEPYIKSFERAASQVELDRLQWASQLGPLVVGKVQATFRALLWEEAYDYEKVKAAILQWLELTPDHYHRLFHAQKSKEDHRPRNLMQLLKDLLDKWVPLGKVERVTLTDQILLEQFMRYLDEDTQL